MLEKYTTIWVASGPDRPYKQGAASAVGGFDPSRRAQFAVLEL